MTVYAVVTIARQFEGDIVSVRFDKAFVSRELAEAFAKTLARTTTETLVVPGSDGPVEFFCERGIHEIIVEA